MSRNGGTGGDGWGHPQVGFEKAMVGTWRATPHPDCIDRLRKHYTHLVEGWFLARKAAWSLSGCMATNSADYYMYVNEWVWSKSRLLIKARRGHGCSFGVRAWTEMEIRFLKAYVG